MENRPRAVFERLFGDAGTTDPEVLAALRQEEHSILDAVTDDIRGMRASLGGADRAKIEQYLGRDARCRAPHPAAERR